MPVFPFVLNSIVLVLHLGRATRAPYTPVSCCATPDRGRTVPPSPGARIRAPITPQCRALPHLKEDGPCPLTWCVQRAPFTPQCRALPHLKEDGPCPLTWGAQRAPFTPQGRAAPHLIEDKTRHLWCAQRAHLTPQCRAAPHLIEDKTRHLWCAQRAHLVPQCRAAPHPIDPKTYPSLGCATRAPCTPVPCCATPDSSRPPLKARNYFHGFSIY